MYIIKNALKSIGRSKGRNVLIGVIVFVIALSCCIGLSIRQAAENAKEQALSEMSITANISFDRTKAMQNMSGEGKEFDKSSFAGMMGNSSALTLDEYKKYATASSVKDFYYNITSYFNGNENFEPVNTETETNASDEPEADLKNDKGGAEGKGGKLMGANSDFTVIGVSGENAMSSFITGTAAVKEGTVFAETGVSNECIITSELAAFNNLSVGDTVKVLNPNNEEESFELRIVGFYSDSSANENSFSRFGSTASDPANKIYVNYETLQNIIKTSENNSANTEEDGETAALKGSIDASYVFSGVEEYEAFTEEVRTLGLDEAYTVSSNDVAAFESSMVPLNTLSTMAKNFLFVILIIGAIILVVLNIFNIRERKYEIGVLTAMGMKKFKVAIQFLSEILVVTIISVILGTAIGAISAVPVTNALLENQITAKENETTQIEQNFGRGDKMPDKQKDAPKVSYVSEINSAMNFTVVLQMLGIGILLVVVASSVAVLFVMRYDPLKILANRD